jgi:hypothetical protein
MRRIAVFLVALTVVGCSGQTPAPSSTPTPVAAASSTPLGSASAAPSASVEPAFQGGLIAIGHSGLTGEGTGSQFEAVPANSWATGTNPDVDSVYLRMVATHPETKAHVANTARGGAVAAELPGMATAALEQVPLPALVIISTIDNDIRCDGTDPDHVVEFGASVKAALDVVTTASPGSKILIVGQAGRPSIDFIEKLIAHDPSLKAGFIGTGMCDGLDANGKPVKAHFAALTAIIDAYEAEEARVCAAVPNCRTDGGVRAAYVDQLANFSPDWAHLNIRGQAAEAALIWPVVLKTLGW